MSTATTRATIIQDSLSSDYIQSRPCPNCYVCGSFGEPLYEELKDKLFGAPGVWNLKICPDPKCGLMWLDPMPLEEEIEKAYRNYLTHADAVNGSNTRLRQLFNIIKDGYLAQKYGYFQGSISNAGKLLGSLMYAFPRRRAYLNAEVLYLPSSRRG